MPPLIQTVAPRLPGSPQVRCGSSSAYPTCWDRDQASAASWRWVLTPYPSAQLNYCAVFGNPMPPQAVDQHPTTVPVLERMVKALGRDYRHANFQGGRFLSAI